MKKRRIVSALLALSLLVPCAFSNQSVVFAATTKEEIFSDGFDAEKIDSVLWETGSDGAGKLQKQYNAMRLDIDTEDWGPDISLLSYKIEKNCSISFSLTNGDIRKWFGIAFGKSKVTDTFTVDASHLFLIYSNMISVMTNTGDGLDDSTIAANSVNGANGAIIADTAAKSTCYVRLDLEKLDSGKYAMDVFAGDDKAELNKLVSYGRAGGLSAEGLELDGYISLSGQQFSLEINEFTITDESGTAFDAEFKPEQISYSGESSKGKVWGITNSWGRYDVYCGAFNRVLLTDGANLISKLPIAKNTQTEQRFKLSFELHAEQSDWKEASFAGVYFDIDESKRFIGVGKHPYSDNFVLVYYQNNRVLDIIELSTGTILNGKNQITMKEYYGDVMTVDINGNECILKNVNSAGKFAFGLYGLNTKIARLAHTYGPGMSIYDGRVQADFLKNVYHNEDIVLKSEGTAVRTYTYISDAVAALYRILLSSEDIVYNIGNEDGKVSIRELAETMVSIYPEKGLKLVFDIPEGGTKGTAPYTLGILSSKKLRSIGWTPKYSVKDGFKRTLEYLAIENID